jgi:RNA polymerase sigma factor (sigma-70 family)
VQRARQGDGAAFDALVQRHRATLIQDALGRAGNHDVAEDIVQEALHRAWSRLSTLRDPAAFLPWLRTIVLNTYRKWYQRRLQAEAPLDDVDLCADPASPPDAACVSQETADSIVQALARLPQENRQALLLASVNAMPYADIALTLGLPLTTVEGRIQRARQQLRRTLGLEWHPMKPSKSPPSAIPYRTFVVTTDVSTLVQRVRNGVPAEQREAAIYLGHLRAGDAVAALIAALDDAHDALREAAAFALGRIGDPRAFRPLLALSARAQDTARAAAQDALSHFPPTTIEAPLLQTMADADDDLRVHAIAWSSRCVTPRVTTALTTVLDDPNPRLRMTALYALGKHLPVTNTDLLAPMLRCARDDDAAVRASAISVLGDACWDQPAVQNLLKDAVFDPSDLVREAVYSALAGCPCRQREPLRDAMIVESLLDSLEQDPLLCRLAAIRALGHLQVTAARDRLLPLLHDPAAAVREAAASALADLGDATVIPALLARLLDAARATLDATGTLECGDVTAFSTALERFGRQAASAWRAALAPEHPVPQREAALILLPRFPDLDLTAEVTALAGDAHPVIRLAAIRALDVRMPDDILRQCLPLLASRLTSYEIRQSDAVPTVMPALLANLDDPASDLRLAAARALASHGDARALEPLLTAFARETDDAIRQALLQAIGALGDARAVPRLQALLDAADGEHRIRLLTTLAALGDGSGMPVIITALKADPSPEVRSAATSLLRDLDEVAAVKPLLHALRDTHDVVRERAAWALSRLKDARAVDALVGTLHDPVEWTRAAACVALGALGDRRAVEPLLRGLQEPDDAPLYGVRARFRARCGMALAWLDESRVLRELPPLLALSDLYVRMELEDGMTGCTAPGAKAILHELADDLMFVTGDRHPRYLGALLALAARGDRQAAAELVPFLANDPDIPVTRPQWWLAYVGRCDFDLARQAIRVLVGAKARHVIPNLAAQLDAQVQEGDAPVSAIDLAEALARFGQPRGTAVIARHLAAPRRDVRYRALTACHEPFPREAPELAASLRDLLAHPDPVTRVLAARGLLARGQAEGIAPLAAVYADHSLGVARKLAAATLDEITAPLHRQALRESAAMDVAAADLQSPRIVERIMAAWVVAAGAAPGAADALQHALQDGSSRVQEAAIRGLGHLGDAAALPSLKKLLHDPSPRLRIAVLQALGALNDRRAIPAILKLMAREEMPPVLDAAVAVLQQLHGEDTADHPSGERTRR